ncbi:MAG: hypothetical protein L6R40_005604 [Gallowayella cf. fulva]|nr:MAG: hypothetical protein L6R40_005604 [Xanthomendoza cf. fulva]
MPNTIHSRLRGHETRDINQSTSPTSDAELSQQTDDPELVHQRDLEICRRIRILCDDNSFRRCNEAFHRNRADFLNWYRANEFLRDLTEGRHDGFTAALENQEHDFYYTSLWRQVFRSSREGAKALKDRIWPHEPPRIALTVPPRYEVTDLPPYTETILPPPYAAEVPHGHVARDVPLCNAHDCPVRMLNIEHCLGSYHHNGQVGPTIQPGGNWLPSLGVSNPPPHVWDAYNHMVLDIDTDYQTRLVKKFIRYHGRPWTPKPQRSLEKKQRSRAQEQKSQSGVEAPPVVDSVHERLKQDQVRRIPRYSYDIPDAPPDSTTDIENQGLEPTTAIDFGAEIVTITGARTTAQGTPDNEGMEAPHTTHTQHTAAHTPRIQHPSPHHSGHRHGSVHIHTPQVHQGTVHLPGIAEVVEQSTVPTPSLAQRMDTVNHGVSEENWMYQRRLIRFADEMENAETNEEWL